MSTNLTGGGTSNLDALTVVGAADFGTPTYSGVAMGRMTRTASQNLSGATIDFTGLPSWVQRVAINFVDASTNGTSNYLIQLGTGATPTWVTTNYKGSSIQSSSGGNSGVNFSSGFLLNQNGQGATCVFAGDLVLKLQNSNIWEGSGVFGESDAARGWWTAGSLSLGAALTAIRITTVNGTDVYDAGTVNILYEG
jgi:hypothetical protein